MLRFDFDVFRLSTLLTKEHDLMKYQDALHLQMHHWCWDAPNRSPGILRISKTWNTSDYLWCFVYMPLFTVNLWNVHTAPRQTRPKAMDIRRREINTLTNIKWSPKVFLPILQLVRLQMSSMCASKYVLLPWVEHVWTAFHHSIHCCVFQSCCALVEKRLFFNVILLALNAIDKDTAIYKWAWPQSSENATYYLQIFAAFFHERKKCRNCDAAFHSITRSFQSRST